MVPSYPTIVVHSIQHVLEFERTDVDDIVRIRLRNHEHVLL